MWNISASLNNKPKHYLFIIIHIVYLKCHTRLKISRKPILCNKIFNIFMQHHFKTYYYNEKKIIFEKNITYNNQRKLVYKNINVLIQRTCCRIVSLLLHTTQSMHLLQQLKYIK